MHDAERNRLWNEWLQTDDGKDYRAGWGDLWTRLHAERGKAWVAERIIERLTAEVERLQAAAEAALAYFEDSVEPTCDEEDDPEDFHDGSAPEANMLRLALGRPPRGFPKPDEETT